MSLTNRKESQSEVRVVVEVDGKPVGFLDLDMDRLWPLVNSRVRETVQVEWVDPSRFQAAMRAYTIRSLIRRLQTQLYESLGNEIVKAALDVESFTLKADAAAQTFGRTRREIEALVQESGRTEADFYTFFWEHLLDEREGVDVKREWKMAGKK